MQKGTGSESLAWEITRLIAECDSLASCAPPLLELLARYAHCRAVELWLRVGGSFELRHSWYAPEIDPLTAAWPGTPGGLVDDLIARAAATGEPASVPLSAANDQRRTVLLRKTGVAKIVAIPLEGSASVEGALVLFHARGRASAGKVEHVDLFAASLGALIERLNAESELRASESRTRAIIESAGAAIVTVDAEGEVQFVNPAFERLLGYTSEEIVGRNIACVVPPPHRERHGEYLRRYLAGDPSAIVGRGEEVTGIRKDGREITLFVTVADIRLAGQRMFTAIVHDHAALQGTIDALRRSRSSLADAQRLAHIGNWTWDIASGAIDWSDEIYRIFDVAQGSFQPTLENFLERVHPDDRESVQRAIETALVTRGRYAIDHRIIRTDGTIATVLEQGELQLEDDVPVRMLGTIQDMTQLRRTSESFWKFYNAVEQAADEVMITDREGRIEYVNPAFEAATGYQFSEVAGRTPRILKSGLQPEGFYEALWSKILAGEVFRGDFVNRARDGRILQEEKTIAPIRNERGEVTHFVATARDIGERRRNERRQEELRLEVERSAAEWRQTFDSIELPILLCDGSGTIRRTNRAASELIGSDAFVGRSIGELPRTEPWMGAANLVHSALAGETAGPREVREQLSGRSWELVATLFPAAGVDRAKVILLVAEVTGVIRLQESLRRTEMMSALGALVAGVAHEVRNPLFAISATIDAFEDRALGPEEFTRFTSRLRAEVDRLTDLMSELLEYGRPSQRELSSSALTESLRDAVESTFDLAKESGVRVAVRDRAEPLPIDADPRGLYLAFRNLIDNAVRHAGSGGGVIVETEADERAVEVRVLDTGPGVRDEDLPRLFDPFFTKRRDGTGLGLAVVQRVIEQHGGTVTLTNRSEGGAIARVRLPLAAGRALAMQ